MYIIKGCLSFAAVTAAVGMTVIAFALVSTRFSVSASSTAPALYDKTGNQLGQIVSGNGSSFYSPVLDRLVTHANGKVTVNVSGAYFKTPDCTDQAFLPQNTLPNPTLVLIKSDVSHYYVVDNHTFIGPQRLGSIRGTDGGCRLLNWSFDSAVDPIFPVTLPFADPLALPLSIAP